MSVLFVSLVMVACGGGDGDGGDSASTLTEWTEQFGGRVDTLDIELAAATNSLNAGDRQAAQGDCTLLAESSTNLRADALPVPDDAIDRALRDALDAIDAAAATCLQGARSGDADPVEAAMALLDDARVAFDVADAAIGAQ